MPSDKPSSVGAMLRAAREGQGLSVNDIAERTRIRSTLIREIESDNFFGCGDTFYARGHVRSIAVSLGLDPGVALAKFDAVHLPTVAGATTGWLPVYDPKAKPPPRTSRQRTPPPARSHPPASSHPPANSLPPAYTYPPPGSYTPPVAPAARPAPTIGRTAKARPPKSSPSWKSAMVAAAFVVALLAGASFLIGYTQGPQSPNTAAPLPTFSLSPEPASSPSSPSPEPSPGVNLQIRVTGGTTYIKVTNGSGTRLFEGELQSGDVKDFSDPKLLTVRFGNASVVQVLVNGVNKGMPTCGATSCSETYKLAEGNG